MTAEAVYVHSEADNNDDPVIVFTKMKSQEKNLVHN